MKKRFVLLSLVFVSVLVSQVSFAQTVYKNFKDGQLYLKLKNDVNEPLSAYNGKNKSELPKELSALINKYGITSIKIAFPLIKTTELEHTYKIMFSKKTKVEQLIKELQKWNKIDYAEKVPLYRKTLTPNDAQYGNQYALPKISAPNAWNLSTGSRSVKIAIVDDEVKLTHQDLAANKWVNPGEIAGNGIDDDNDGYIDDVNGFDVGDNDGDPNPPASATNSSFTHGTHCAGIADGVSNNSLGIASIGYSCSLMGVKCNPDNISNPDVIQYGIEGVQYAIAAHADVVSLSWGAAGGYSTTEQNIFTAGWNQGIIFVAAAGNDGANEAFYPAQYTHVLSVGATDNNDQITSYSNYGAWIGVMAPGDNILSSVAGSNSSYAYFSGTSMATPLVAGLCGLMKSYSPSSTNAQIITCLKSSCDNINSVNSSFVGLLGSGRVNAYAALQCLTAPPTANFTANGTQTCSGNVQFTDLTSGTPTSWSWNFGDGGTSTARNPSHQYLTNGTFTVSLTATNSITSNTNTKTNYITVSKPAAPSTTGGTHCGSGSVALSASTGNTVNWYASATGTTVVSTANPFNTQSLSNTTTYYVEENVPATISHLGPTDNNVLGAGGYFSNSTDRYLIFNVLSTCTLKSVVVYAQAAGSRVIALRDSTGATLQSTTINLNAGANTVTLNYTLTPGNNLQLAINGTSNLYRNNAVTNAYPITLPGFVSITGTNAGSGLYYYFYDWQIQGPACISLRAPVTATIAPGLSVTPTGTNVSCNGGSNGSISLSVSGGSPSYTYSWSNGATTNTINNVAAGVYTVIVTDATGCSGIAAQTLTQPTAVSGNTNVTNVSCNGGNTGAINLTPSGGNGSYTYHWNDGVSTQNRTSITNGTYTVTITDGNSCSGTSSATVTQPTALSASITPTNGSCSSSGGSATANISGGTSGYTYNWSNGGNTATISNLGSGSYNLTVTDSHNCTTTATTAIANSGSLSVSATSTNINCFGAATGSAGVTVTGNTGQVTYNWSNGATGATINNVVAGTYTVTVSDASNCTVTVSKTITQGAAINITLTATNAACGSSNGSANSTISGGTSGYSYSWNTGATSNGISNVAPGNYTLTITDAHSCTASASTIVNSAGSLHVNALGTNESCYGGTNGSIIAAVTGATNPITYAWSNGGSASVLQNIPAGTYTLTVTDGSGCSAIASQTLTQPTQITVNVSTTAPTCAGRTDGLATVSASGGASNYSYMWASGFGTSTKGNLSAGSYTVTVEDGSNCSTTASFNITDPTAITANATANNNICFGGSNGSAQVTVSGGTSPYTYSWNNGSTNNALSGLTAGDYTVTITDHSGCTSTATTTVTQPNPLQITTSTTNTTTGQQTGSATVVDIYGAVAPYSFNWSNGDTSRTINNLSAGTYTVTLTDANGCQKTATATVSETTGINEVSNSLHLQVYPNPANATLAIQLSALNGMVSYSVKNVLGQAMLTGNISTQLTQLDVSLLASGVYFIEVKQAGRNEVRQFVVSR